MCFICSNFDDAKMAQNGFWDTNYESGFTRLEAQENIVRWSLSKRNWGETVIFFYIDPKVRLFLINRHDHPSINKEGSPFHDGGMTTPH